MASFYGNIKNNSRASFIFDRIYSSRVDMEIALKENLDENGEVQGDGVFINRYVLINYGYSADGSYVAIDPSEVNASNVKELYLEINTGLGYSEYRHPEDPISYDQIYYQKVNFVDRFTYGQLENTYYSTNRQKDRDAFHADYDLTVWMKIYSNNEEKYIMVAKLSVDPAAMELIVDAPADKNGGAHFDLLQSSDINYVYHIPNAWQVKLNEYNPEDALTYTLNNDVDGYWQYEFDTEEAERTYNTQHEYPYYNEAGFDPYIQTTSEEEDEIIFTDARSGRRYLNHMYVQIDLTPDTYRRNQYYIYQNGKYVLAVGEFNKNENYFIKTQAVSDSFQEVSLNQNTYRRNYYYIPIFDVDENNEPTEEISGYVISSGPYVEGQRYFSNTAESEQIDTKRLDISLPSIGNAVSAMYDSIYGQPNEASGYLLGYTDEITLSNYYEINANNIPEKNDIIVAVKPKDEATDNDKYCVSQADIDNLYHDDTLPHNIPIYDTTGTRRPYTEGQLFDATNIDPYDNINPNDPVSMAWGVYEIKKYLSELRFLAAGEGVIGYIKEADIAQLTENPTNGIYKISVPTADPTITEDKYYTITEQQLEDYVGTYDASEGRIIPVRKTRGIQADWGLDDVSAFGYIYHKPRVLWSWDEIGYEPADEGEIGIQVLPPEQEDTDYYAKTSIEYIYDHYNDEGITNNDLFGPERNQDTWLTAKV